MSRSRGYTCKAEPCCTKSGALKRCALWQTPVPPGGLSESASSAVKLAAGPKSVCQSHIWRIWATRIATLHSLSSPIRPSRNGRKVIHGERRGRKDRIALAGVSTRSLSELKSEASTEAGERHKASSCRIRCGWHGFIDIGIGIPGSECRQTFEHFFCLWLSYHASTLR